jgi:FkbH-like protein
MESRRQILDWLESDPSSTRYITAARRLDEIVGQTLPEIRIAILRNIIIEPIAPYLKVHCSRLGMQLSLQLGNYDNLQQDVFQAASPLFEFKPDIVVLALRLQLLAPKLVLGYTSLTAAEVEELSVTVLDRVQDLVQAIRKRSTALILVHNFEQPAWPAYGILDAQWSHGQRNAIARLNQRLAESLQAIGSAFTVDVEGALSRLGYDRAIDDRYWHVGRAPYRPPLLEQLSREYVRFAAALKGKNKKCLVLDCDNTLWGGIIGEDGIHGIHLGADHPGSAYLEFQQAILDFYHRGILLAINSKNNEREVLDVLEKHPASLLKSGHFVAKRINWNDKATNLREIAAELRIGTDSLVFVDDNPAECAYVRRALPEIEVVQLPPDPTGYRRLLQSLDWFDTLALTEEDRKRSGMYQQEVQRQQLRQGSDSIEDYLRSLEMNVQIAKADDYSIPRIAQLTQKTNQFNVTTRRYTEQDVRLMKDDPAFDVLYAAVQDRFSDNGIIAVAIVGYENDLARIDTFLMSCRVIGRGIEQTLLATVLQAARERGCRFVQGEYIATTKNEPAKNLFAQSGFTSVEHPERNLWTRDLSLPLLQNPDWFREVRVNWR